MNMYNILVAIYFIWKNYYCDILYHNFFEESNKLTDYAFLIFKSTMISENIFKAIKIQMNLILKQDYFIKIKINIPYNTVKLHS